MANTSPVHKAKRSQKRKDRQERKHERQMRRKRENLEIGEKTLENGRNGENPEESSPEEPKRRRKTLPGYLAKNSAEICRWLRNYLYLFMKADDAHIGFLDGIPRERRDELVQEYVDVRNFVSNVEKLRTGEVEPEPENPVIKENPEISEKDKTENEHTDSAEERG